MRSMMIEFEGERKDGCVMSVPDNGAVEIMVAIPGKSHHCKWWELPANAANLAHGRLYYRRTSVIRNGARVFQFYRKEE